MIACLNMVRTIDAKKFVCLKCALAVNKERWDVFTMYYVPKAARLGVNSIQIQNETPETDCGLGGS